MRQGQSLVEYALLILIIALVILILIVWLGPPVEELLSQLFG
jgi:Flp pilus assembly pilin Flp